MTAVGLEGLEHTVQLTHTWINELDDRLGWNNKPRSYRLLKAVLHALRDWLQLNEAADLAAQLPTLLRGAYYEQWRPATTPVNIPAGFRPSAALWNAITGAAKEVGRAAETGAGRFARSGPSSRRARHATRSPIWAWAGEFIARAAAVRKYGLCLFHAQHDTPAVEVAQRLLAGWPGRPPGAAHACAPRLAGLSGCWTKLTTC